MWLERFSVQPRDSPPSPSPNRTLSPAPRRSIQLGPSTLPRRPGIQPRSSSLSLASVAGSTESLPAAAKVSNGSNLKHQLSQTAGTDAIDPLDVLQGIVGERDDGIAANFDAMLAMMGIS